MISIQSAVSGDDYRKLLKEYSLYSVNLKNWLYEDLTSIMGQSPPGWFFELVYKDAHSPLIYWMREKPGLSGSAESESNTARDSLDEIIAEFGLIRDGPILRVQGLMGTDRLESLKTKLSALNYEYIDGKRVFRPRWTGVKK